MREPDGCRESGEQGKASHTCNKPNSLRLATSTGPTPNKHLDVVVCSQLSAGSHGCGLVGSHPHLQAQHHIVSKTQYWQTCWLKVLLQMKNMPCSEQQPLLYLVGPCRDCGWCMPTYATCCEDMRNISDAGKLGGVSALASVHLPFISDMISAY